LGRGKLFGPGINRLEDEAIGGWKLGFVASLHSGFPVTITSTQEYFVNQRATRANHYRPLKVRNQSTNAWFGADPSEVYCASNTDNGVCANGQESSTGFGTASVGSERAPSYKDFDMAASQSFAISEAGNLEFRADFFNLLNTASLGPPNQQADFAQFGLVNSVNSTERSNSVSPEVHFLTDYRNDDRSSDRLVLSSLVHRVKRSPVCLRSPHESYNLPAPSEWVIHIFQVQSIHRLSPVGLSPGAIYLAGITLLGLQFRSQDRSLKDYSLCRMQIPLVGHHPLDRRRRDQYRDHH
jgi:hypothetical protein